MTELAGDSLVFFFSILLEIYTSRSMIYILTNLVTEELYCHSPLETLSDVSITKKEKAK